MSTSSAYSLLASSASTKTTRLLRCRLALLFTVIVSCYNCKSADALSVSLASNSGRFVPELYQLLLHCNVSKNPHYVFWYYSSLPGGPDRALLARCHWDTATCAIEPSFHNWTNLAVSANGTLSLARVAKSQDGYYECNAFIDQLDAKEGIRLVVISSGSEPSIAQSPSLLTSGDRATFTCSSGNGWNPAPRLTWLKIPTAGESVDLTPEAAYSPPGNKFYSASSVLSLTVYSSDHEAVLVCSTVQIEISNSSVSTEVKLLVQHKPTIATNSDLTAVEGTSVTIACSARGYPQPQMQLVSANGSVIQDSPSGHFTLSPVIRSHAGGLACRAVNSLGVATSAFRLSVLYQPTVRTPASMVVDAGGSVSLPCTVDGNPLPPEIEWRHSATGFVVKLSTASADNGALQLNGVDPRRHAGEWRCEVQSTLAASSGQPTTYSASSAVSLTVRYRPGPPAASQPREAFLAGQPVNLTCRANQAMPGQPPPSLAWVRTDPARSAMPPGSTVQFQSVGLSDSGSYACRAVNELGASESAPVSLLVRQAPNVSIDVAPSTESARAGSTDFSLVCRARANPAPRLRWLRDGVRTQPTMFTELAGLGNDPYEYQLVLHFRGTERSTMRLNDTGVFQCSADNELGNSTAEHKLDVMTEPMIVNNFDKASLVPGKPASLTCEFVSHPGYRVTWLTPDRSAVTGSASITSADGPPWRLTSSAPLLLRGDDQPVLGNYTCQVSNSLGTVQRRLQMLAASPPDPPRRLSAVPVAWDSIRIAWQPGFDGGYPARLRLRLVGWNASVGVRTATSPPLLVDADAGEVTIGGLFPDTAYTVICVAENRLGESASAPMGGVDVIVSTGHLRLPQVRDASWDPTVGRLAFRGLPGYCARVEASADAGATWRSPAAADGVGCLAYQPDGLSVAVAPASLPAEAASSSAASSLTSSDGQRSAVLYRVSLCLVNRTDVCGSPFTTYPVAVPGTVSLNTIIIVACVCGVVIVALAIVLIWLCTRRCNQARAKAAAKVQQPGFELQSGKRISASATAYRQGRKAQDPEAENNGGLHHHPAVAFVSPTSVASVAGETRFDDRLGLSSPPPHAGFEGSAQLDGTMHLFPNAFYESDATDNSGSPPTTVKNPRKVIYEVVV